MTVAHKSGEHVVIEDLRKCVEYLRAAIDRFCR
jgi:acetylornithine deacetylase/succinyl-diaminopimelate desuccinylase-like protein